MHRTSKGGAGARFSMTDETFMKTALKEAERAFEKGDCPIGAVVVHESKIIARAHNQVELLKDPTAHAEMIAITQAAATLGQERLLNTTMYVTMEPCAMCAGALVLSRVKRLVFGVPDPKAGACGTLYNIIQDERLNHRLEVVSGILAEPSRALVQEFFRKLRKEKR